MKLLKTLCLFSLLPAIACASSSRTTKASSSSRADECQVKVMTRNLYHGGDATTIFQANGFPEFVFLFGGFLGQVLRSKFEFRMNAIADEIADAGPDFVGIQEGNKWVFDYGEEITEVFDFVDMILQRLKNFHGLHYEIAAQADPPAFDQTTPAELSDFLPEPIRSIRWQWGDFLLVREGVSYKSAKMRTYRNFVTYDNPIVGPTLDQRSWLLVKSRICGHNFRVLTTHLEPFDQEIRVAQAYELLMEDFLKKNADPIIAIGDLNSAVGSEDDDAVGILMEEGNLRNAWAETGGDPSEPTLFDDDDLLGSNGSKMDHVDHILFSDEFEVLDAALIDTMLNPGELVPSDDRPKRPSDHAGVAATFILSDCESKSKAKAKKSKGDAREKKKQKKSKSSY